jgi:hypothetical protein
MYCIASSIHSTASSNLAELAHTKCVLVITSSHFFTSHQLTKCLPKNLTFLPFIFKSSNECDFICLADHDSYSLIALALLIHKSDISNLIITSFVANEVQSSLSLRYNHSIACTNLSLGASIHNSFSIIL